MRSTFGDRLGEVRLFGSFARGEANDRSDVDVLVLVDGLTSFEMLPAVGEATPVLLDTGLPMSPVVMSTERFEQQRQGERAFLRARRGGNPAMTRENRRRAIADEIKHGADALRAARALREIGLSNDALSGLYYAVFHYATALLLRGRGCLRRGGAAHSPRRWAAGGRRVDSG